MQLKLFGKTFFAMASFALLALGALTLVVYVYGGRYQAHIDEMNNEVVSYAEAETNHIFTDLAKNKVCETARTTAMAAEVFMDAQHMTLAALGRDENFATITARTIFSRGATGVVSPKDRLVITHPRADLVGKRLPDLAEYSDLQFTPLWDLFDESVRLDEVSGTYLKGDPDGTMREHVVCFQRIPMLTSDNVRVVSFANAYRDDLGINANMLSSSLRQKYGAASTEAMNTVRDMRDFLALAFLILFFGAFVLAWLFSERLSGRLYLLSQVCQHIASGRLDTEVPIFKNKDEVAELAISVAEMQKQLSLQAGIIAEQTRRYEVQARDLKDALRIAEERTKQYMKDRAK